MGDACRSLQKKPTYLEGVYMIIDPDEIVEEVKKYITGQDEVIRVVVHAFILQYLKYYGKELMIPEMKIHNPPILLIGNSGVGKTYIPKIVGKVLNEKLTDIDFFNPQLIDSSGCTSKGWTGGDLDEEIIRCYKDNPISHGYDVYILDEFDKVIIGHSNLEEARNVTDSRKDQNIYLKILEGIDLKVGVNENIYTGDALFILTGCFENLHIQKNRDAFSIGYLKTKQGEKHLKEYLLNFGMRPEILGRIGNIALLNDLTENDLKNILFKAKGSPVERWKNLLEVTGVKEPDLNDFSLKKVLKEKYVAKTGARGVINELDTFYMSYFSNNLGVLDIRDPEEVVDLDEKEKEKEDSCN